MSDMFWIALELSIPKIGFNIMLSVMVKKLDAFKFDGVAESDNTGGETRPSIPDNVLKARCQLFLTSRNGRNGQATFKLI